MSRRLLIASGTSNYPGLPPGMDRPVLGKAVESIAQLFSTLGYVRVLEEVGQNPTARNLEEKLDEWFGSRERQTSDWVIFYYTGHGELTKANELYLLTTDSNIGRLTTSAFGVQRLADMLIGSDSAGENRRVRRLLIILDACHAGAGAFDLNVKLFASLFSDRTDLVVAVLAAAFPQDEAFAGALAKAFTDAVEDVAVGGSQQEFLDLDLVPAIRQRLRGQKAIYLLLTTEARPEFIPNPRFIARLPVAATVEEIRRAAEIADLRAHWSPRARGVEFDAQPGSFFTGRFAALNDLGRWIRSDGDQRTTVVTGAPGIGKSAVLSKIVTLSDPEYRRAFGADRWNRAFPEGLVDVAIHAKGKTASDVLSRISQTLDVPAERQRVLLALGERKRPFRIVIDALDEAAEPDRVAELLKPMHEIRGVKLLVGTRPEFAALLGDSVTRIDLGEPKYSNEEDIAEYIISQLVALGGPRYEDREFAAAVARAAATRATSNFLIARLVSQDLIQSPPQDLADLQGREFPATVDMAFANYLARYGDQESRIRDLLRPVAWALGAGLPWTNVWANVASALSDREYTDEDVRWMLNKAGAFILEVREEGRSVYRLFHQAAADHIRNPDRERERDIHERFTKVLHESVLTSEESGQPDWRTAHPYIRKHLAEHASRCGRLGNLVNDPLFLLCADPVRLLRVLPEFVDKHLRTIATIYRDSSYQIRTEPFGMAAAYLECAARKRGAVQFAEAAAAVPGPRTWRTRWLEWDQSQVTRLLTRPTEPPSAVALAEVDGRAYVGYGYEDGRVEVVDCDENRLVRRLKIQEAAVRALALAAKGGKLVIASGDENGDVEVWSIEGGRLIGAPIRTESELSALALSEVNERLMLAWRSGGVIWLADPAKPNFRYRVSADFYVGWIQFQKIEGAERLLAGRSPGYIESIDPGTGLVEEQVWPQAAPGGSWSVSVSFVQETARGRLIVAAGPDGVRIADDSGEQFWEFRSSSGLIIGVRAHELYGEAGFVFVHESGEARWCQLPDFSRGRRRLGPWQEPVLTRATVDGRTLLAVGSGASRPALGPLPDGKREVEFRWAQNGAIAFQPATVDSGFAHAQALYVENDRLLVVTDEGLYDVRSGSKVASLAILGRPVRRVRRGGRWALLALHRDGVLSFFDPSSGKRTARFIREERSRRLYEICVAELGGRWLAAYTRENRLIIREVETGALVGIPAPLGGDTYLKALGSFDGIDSVIMTEGDRVSVRTVDALRELAAFSASGSIVSVGQIASRSVVVAAGRDGIVTIFWADAPQPLRIDAGASISDMVLNPPSGIVLATDGGLLAIEIAG